MRRFPPRRGRIGSLALLPGLALLAAACGGNPNADVDADEFIRPPAAGAATATDTTRPGASPDGASPGTAAATAAATNADAAEDIVRRYLSDVYGYSLELVCGPFCDTAQTQGELDRVGVLAETQDAIITIRVVDAGAATLTDLQTLWEQERRSNATFSIQDQQDTVLPSDGVAPARILNWQIDQRATGGSILRYRTLITRVGPLAYFLDTGAVAEVFEEMEPYLQRALETFIAAPAPEHRPGLYDRWGFAFPYNADRATRELGFGAPAASVLAGVLEQRTLDGVLEQRLIWDTVSADLFDAAQTVEDSVGELPEGTDVTRQQLALTDGTPVTAAVFQGPALGADIELGVFAWYCADGGRSFILQAFAADDVLAFVQPGLRNFRCGPS